MPTSAESEHRTLPSGPTDSPMHGYDYEIEAESDSSPPQEEETSDHSNPPHAPLDERFLIHDGRLNYYYLRNRAMLENRYISICISDTTAGLALIRGSGLLNTISDVCTFPREVILEFYANFSATPDDRVFVRGSMFEFSPQSINRVYKTPDIEPHPISECDRVPFSKHILAKHLSEGRCVHWSSPFSPQIMPNYLATLFRISCYNWIPTENVSEISIECAKLLYMIDQGMKFNFGKLVFDQIARVARSPGHLREIIPFANLIYKVLASQKSPMISVIEYAEINGQVKTFDTSLHRYGYNPSADPRSSRSANAKTISDDLRAQAQELDRQSLELRMRATQLRTMAGKMDGRENGTSSS